MSIPPLSPAQRQCWQPEELGRILGPRALCRWGGFGHYAGLRTTQGFPGSSEGPSLTRYNTEWYLYCYPDFALRGHKTASPCPRGHYGELRNSSSS